MKNWILSIGLLLPLAGMAQDYSLDWSAFGEGADASTSTDYSLTATIGQPTADHSTSADYTLDGGFWAITGAPLLQVALTPTNTVCVWWALTDPAWKLQSCPALVPSGSTWTGCSYHTNGPNCCYVEPVPTGRKYYRLKLP